MSKRGRKPKMPPASAVPRFFRRAAPYAAAGALVLAWLQCPPKRKPSAAAGHLGLLRARPGLEELGASLTRNDLLADAACALGASVLRVPIFTGGLLRQAPRIVSERAAVAESDGDADRAARYRLVLALLDASNGRAEEALEAAAGLARERPADPEPRLAAGVLCYLLGRAGDGEEWLGSIPEVARRGNACPSEETAVPSLTGKGVDKLLVRPASWLRDAAVLSALENCDLSVEQSLHISAVASLVRRYHSGEPPDMTVALKMMNVLTLEYLRLLSVLLRTNPTSNSSGDLLARVEAEGDARAAADVNLLLALLAARDGDFDEALGRYARAVRSNPSDLRPYMLAAMLCRLTGRLEDLDKWRVRAQHARSAPLHDAAATDEAQLLKLLDELAVAVALGHGALTARGCPQGGTVMLAAWREVDAGMAEVLQGKELSLKQRLLIRVYWAFLRALLKSQLAMADQDSKRGG